MELSFKINIIMPDYRCGVESPIQPCKVRASTNVCPESPEISADIDLEVCNSSSIPYNNNALEREKDLCAGGRCYV